MAGSEARVIRQRAPIKRCLLHDDVKKSNKLTHLPCDFSDCLRADISLKSSNIAEEKFTPTDSWSILNSVCSPGKMSNVYFELNSSVQNDYQSPLDESFMFRFSKNGESDSLKAENVSLGSFVDLKTLLSGQDASLECGYAEELSPGQEVTTGKFLTLETNDHIENSTEGSSQMSKATVRCESVVKDKNESGGELESSALQKSELRLVGREATSFEGSKHLQSASKLQSKQASWRTADTEELAALVARKSLEHLENCDLPPSQSQLEKREVLKGWDLNPTKRHRWEISRSVDRDFLISFLHEKEPVCHDRQILGRSDPLSLHHVLPSSKSLPAVSEQIISVKDQLDQIPRNSSARARVLTYSAGEVDPGPQLLGEALCRSQTRAREAEKAAAQALLEKEHLMRLLFREASRSLTYRQWVKSLQVENMTLRLQAGNGLSGRLTKHNVPNSCTADFISNSGWRHKELTHSRKKYSQEVESHCNVVKDYKELKRRRSMARSDAVGGYNIGLAFAFGLSLAGAGLVLGWSMGWLFFSPL